MKQLSQDLAQFTHGVTRVLRTTSNAALFDYDTPRVIYSALLDTRVLPAELLGAVQRRVRAMGGLTTFTVGLSWLHFQERMLSALEQLATRSVQTALPGLMRSAESPERYNAPKRHDRSVGAAPQADRRRGPDTRVVAYESRVAGAAAAAERGATSAAAGALGEGGPSPQEKPKCYNCGVPGHQYAACRKPCKYASMPGGCKKRNECPLARTHPKSK